MSYPSICIGLPMPTADPAILTKAATRAVMPRIIDGVKCVRAGIMVTDLRPAGNQRPPKTFDSAHEE